MKGFAHFISGIALATFFPDVVREAAQGAIGPALAGIAAMLPDALDFRFARWLEQPDRAVDPQDDPPDPGVIARMVKEAVEQAAAEGRAIRLMLHTLRVGPDAWRRYIVRFDPEGGAVEVRIGPVVSTGGRPIRGTELSLPPVRLPLGVPVRYDYDPEVAVDIFSGPSLAFVPEDNAVRILFLPWHRAWSHSFVLAALLGIGAGLIGGARIGWIVGLAYALHVLEDQIGWMGSNLFWPFTRHRIPGLRWMRSVDPWPNFTVVWVSMIFILWNLDRFSPSPHLPPWFPLLAFSLPLLLRWVGRHPVMQEEWDEEDPD
ncbi:MAG: metal-dependent hydrolase [Thermoflexus sp.]